MSQFSGRQLEIVGAQRFHFLFFAPKCFQNGRKPQKNSPKWAKIARKLRSVAKIARLHKNAKVAQKLRCATSQFSGGGTKHLRLWNSTNAEANDASQYQYPAVVWWQRTQQSKVECKQWTQKQLLQHSTTSSLTTTINCRHNLLYTQSVVK